MTVIENSKLFDSICKCICLAFLCLSYILFVSSSVFGDHVAISVCNILSYIMLLLFAAECFRSSMLLDDVLMDKLLVKHLLKLHMTVLTVQCISDSFCVWRWSAFSALRLLVGRHEEHPVCKNWVMRCWCGCLSGAGCRLFAYWSSWCHCHPQTPTVLASFKSRLVLPFWYCLTQVVLEKGH